MTDPAAWAELDGMRVRLTALETASGSVQERQTAVKDTLVKLEAKIDAQTEIMHAMALTLAGSKVGFRVAVWFASAAAAVGGFLFNHSFNK